jgi:hypothetical protein
MGWGFFDFTDFIPVLGTVLRVGQSGVLAATGHGDEAKHAIAMGGVNLGADVLTVVTFGAGATEAEAARVAAKAAASGVEHAVASAAEHGVVETVAHVSEHAVVNVAEHEAVEATERAVVTTVKPSKFATNVVPQLSKPTRIALGATGAGLVAGSLALDVMTKGDNPSPESPPDAPPGEARDERNPNPMCTSSASSFLAPTAAGALVAIMPGLSPSKRVMYGGATFAGVYAYQQYFP